MHTVLNASIAICNTLNSKLSIGNAYQFWTNNRNSISRTLVWLLHKVGKLRKKGEAVKITVSSQGENLDSAVDPRFGRAGQAIDFPERTCGEWFVSETRFGPMVPAQLAIGAENSGKLVSIVRKEARKIAEEIKNPWLIVDGPPGIACPLIASITGASLALVVIEPTLSGELDVERVLALTRHFGAPAVICINKGELNPQVADQIEKSGQSSGATIAGRIRYDRAVTKA